MISRLELKVYKLNLAKKINYYSTGKRKMDADKARSLRVQKRIEEKLGLQGKNQLDCKILSIYSTNFFPILYEIILI